MSLELNVPGAGSVIKDNWPALIMELNKEAAGGNSQHDGLVSQIHAYGFIALTCIFSDVLPVMNKLNLHFQGEDITLASIQPMLQASVAILTQLRQPRPRITGLQAWVCGWRVQRDQSEKGSREICVQIQHCEEAVHPTPLWCCWEMIPQ